MLVIGGLACGIISGLALSLTIAPDTTEPKKYSPPAEFNMAHFHKIDQDAVSLVPVPVPVKKHSAKSITTIAAINTEDPAAINTEDAAAVNTKDTALAYLEASKSLSYDSKTILASINNTNLDRPTWSWSREDFSVAYATVNSIFGVTKKATELKEVVVKKSVEKPTAKQQLAEALPAQDDATQALVESSTAYDIAVPDILAKDRLVVVLDPGHGGTDPGSEAHNGLVEKELTLDMAQRVELFLSEIENVDVIMTRNDDVGMSRQNRVNKIKAVGADVVVSLHFNHLPQRNINLVETFYADRHNVVESLTKQNKSPSSVNLDHTNASRTLAHIMHNKVFNEVANANAQNSVIDAGVKSETLFVLTRSFTPGVLLELTCISNPAEAERLVEPEYRNQLAASIADGLRDYLVELHSEKFDELLVKLDL